MTWIGINPFPPGYAARKARPNMAFDPSGNSHATSNPDMLLARGTVMLETEIPNSSNRPLPLLSFQSDTGWTRRFSITLDQAQSIRLTIVQGPSTTTTSIESSELIAGSRIRVSYTWDAPARSAHLTIQSMDRLAIHQAAVANPVPLPLADLREIVSIGPATFVEDGIACLAVADHIAPICMSSGLMRGTLIGTAEGYRSVERLALGDLIQTASSGQQPIRWITRVEVPAVGQFAPIRLRAPFFGLLQDIVVAQDQGVIMTGPDAEYLFGSDTVLVKARDLTSLHSVQYEPDLPTVTYYQILLDNHECIDVAGTWAESLFLGQLAAAPGLAKRTSLADLPVCSMPRHGQSVARSLRSYEAASLLTELSA